MTIISLPILLIIGFGNAMCGTTNEVVFKSRTDTELVVMRSNGCGAWDSEFPTYTIHKIVPMTPIFNFVTKFDTTNIDKTIWVKNIDK